MRSIMVTMLQQVLRNTRFVFRYSLTFGRAIRAGLIAALLGSLLLASPLAAEVDVSELGPAPLDADGRYDNYVGVLSHGSNSVRRSFLWNKLRGVHANQPGAPERIENDGARLRQYAQHRRPSVTWVGHATVLVQMDGVTFLTDPTWSKTASPVSFFGPKRFVAPGIEIANLPKIDFVVVSHNHYDHLDLGTLEALAKRDPTTLFLVPLDNEQLLKRNGIENVEALDWGESTQVGGVRVYCVPAQHWSKRSFWDEREALWSSWAVVGTERRFYFGGDTGYFDGFAKIGKAFDGFDLVALPIGAYEPVEMMKASHMNPEEAVQAALDLSAERTLAIHYGTFDLAEEPLGDPPARFGTVATERLAPGSGWIMRVGETREF